jgi:hypothetical protein
LICCLGAIDRVSVTKTQQSSCVSKKKKENGQHSSNTDLRELFCIYKFDPRVIWSHGRQVSSYEFISNQIHHLVGSITIDSCKRMVCELIQSKLGQ